MGIVDGKVAIVTGGGRGVGRGHALALAAHGARVVVNDVDADVAEEVTQEIRKAGGTAVAHAASVGTRESCEGIVRRAVAEWGRLDAMIANAGILRDRTMLNMSDEEFDDVWTIHVKGTFWCGQLAARQLRDQGQGGVIINTTSAAHMGNFGQTNYSGAKGAIASMTYTWALELARLGIRVNAISPSGLTRLAATFAGATTLKPTPENDPALNAPLVVWLCSDEASYVTGQIFGTGGDRLMLLSQPKYYFGAIRAGGWTVEEVQKRFKADFGNRLEPIGLAKAPYPFYGGVKPEPKKA